MKKIEAGTVLGDYLGKLIRPSEEDAYERKYGLYGYYYNDKATIYPDVKAVGMQLVNHSCMPNCAFFPYHGHSLYYAIRTIFPGEELTIQYFLNAVKEGEDDYYICHCKSPFCRGTMCNHNSSKDQEVLKFIKSRQGKYLNIMEVPFGYDLPRLKKYPEKIGDYSIYDLFGNWQQVPLICFDKIIPTVKELRQRIRASGRILRFKKLKMDVWGIADNLIIAKRIK